ncbi:saccharopine dehydrogenase-like oxidoreductase [Aplysia californica]|uniref:Saccharopine dehydrogenase-like oxidoreductase n=1 Tax=Aplysia californica TaxID=6500 RepID=A0ABM0JJF0_APLCA|nr:saccharopine dehydrogenase-like oxidoreductase [Aplysia californica]
MASSSSPTRKYDMIVFGASGFTGQYVVDEVARVAEEEGLKWAVSGRNMDKLQKVLGDASQRTGMNLEEVPVVIADTGSPTSLLEMAEQTKLVLNCVGPYRFYGEQVVKACVEGGAHHLDISGEPQYLEKMQLMYNGKAKENGVFVIGAVGFDSIPAEMGMLYTQKQFTGGQLSNVESFLTTETGNDGAAINTGTLESAIHGFAHAKELKPLRRSLFPDPMPKYDFRLPKRSTLFFSKEVNKWCLPFPGSDKSVVTRTIRNLLSTDRLEKPIEFCPYVACKSLGAALGVMVFAVIFALMTSFSLGQSLLMKYPHIFSFGAFKKGGPTKKQIDSTSFAMTFVGHGYPNVEKDRSGQKPNKIVITKVMGPEPGYVTTPICMVQSAVTVLKCKDKFGQPGGVMTAGSAFWDTDLIERLEKHNMKFVTVSENKRD